MKLDFLRIDEGNRRLVLIIAGWNIPPQFFSDITLPDGWDLAVAYGFSDLDPILLPDRYATVYLYAWSFGVVAAESVVDPASVTEAFAIAGTPWGIGERGIPYDIFDATRANLSPASLAKFRRRMLSGIDRAKRDELLDLLDPNPDIEALKEELTAIEKAPKNQNIPWRRAYVGVFDLVIPPDAQRLAWSSHPASPVVVELAAGHCPDFRKIILETLPDTKNTALNFSLSHTSYSSNASSQCYFAKRLAEELKLAVANPPKRILEIGNGSGLLSRLLAEMWPDAEATYLDLYPIEPGGFFNCELQIVADAEDWLETASGSWDLIVSSSAIQWFANPERFFVNASRLLAPGGVVGCSVYSSGNLCELDAVRLSPIHYHTAEGLEKMARRSFDSVVAKEEKLFLEFPTAREALLHLRDTGVRGRGSSTSLPDLLRALTPPHLSFVSTRLICKFG